MSHDLLMSSITGTNHSFPNPLGPYLIRMTPIPPISHQKFPFGTGHMTCTTPPVSIPPGPITDPITVPPLWDWDGAWESRRSTPGPAGVGEYTTLLN